MKTPKPIKRTLIVETEEALRKIQKLYPDSDFIRGLKYIELRLPTGANAIVNDKVYQTVRFNFK